MAEQDRALLGSATYQLAEMLENHALVVLEGLRQLGLDDIEMQEG